MALRGETVGTAYVRILADGSGLPRSIKDQMDDAEPIMAAAGQRHSKAYDEAFEQEMKKGGSKRINKALNEGIGRSDAIENLFAGSDWKKFLNRMERQFGDVGVLIGHNIQEGVRDSGDLDVVARRLSNISGEVRRAQAEIASAGDSFEREFRRNLASIDRDVTQIGNAIDREAGRMRTAFRSVNTAVRGLGVEISRNGDQTIREMGRGSEESGSRLERLGGHVDKFALSYGKAFGKGSRNNLLNFFGAFMTLPIRAVGALATFTQGAISHIGKLQALFSEAGGGVAGFAKVGGSLAKSGAVALGILAGIVAMAGPVAGALSAIAGGLTALASSVSFGLVGGLGAIAGLLPVIAFGAATVGLAFIGMSDDAKKALQTAIKPMKEELKDLQKAAQTGTEKGGGIFGGIKEGADDLAGAMGLVTPLIEDISDAIGDVIQSFADAANSQGFAEFVATMQTFIPDAIRTLGRVATNVLGGLGGLFEGLVPIAQRFLAWIDRVAQSFSDWTNDPGNQNRIKDFMDRAGDSASDLWDLLKKVGEALGKLLFNEEGRKAGGSIIDDMTAQVQRFINWLEANPDALEQWFKDGKQMAKDIGNAIEGLLDLFDQLDTPQNRKIASATIGAIGDALRILPILIKTSGIGLLVGQMMRAATAIKSLATAVGITNRAIRSGMASIVDRFLSAVGSIVNGAAEAFGWVPSIGPKLRAAASKFNTFRAEVTAAIKGVPKDVVINFSFSGGQEMKNQIADLQWELKQIPRSVTINVLNKIQRMPTASGGIFSGPQTRLIGEAGPEAVVPLNRPLSQVDPAVRALSAVAQGKASTVTNNNGRTVEVGGLTIITPTKDPAAVAREAVNQLVASSYL